MFMRQPSTTKIDLTVSHSMSEDELLKVLNTPPGLSDSESLRAANVVRPWIAEWIKTGALPGGGEDPWSRRWSDDRAGGVYAAINYFLETYLRFYIDGNKIAGIVDLPGPNDFEGYCNYLAFVFLSSDIRFRLMECVDCGKYFLLPKRRSIRKTSPRCEDCYPIFRGKDSVEIGKRSRQAKRKEVYAFIANEFAQEIGADASWFKNSALIEEIVQAVNTQIKRKKLDHESITTKWVLRGVNPDHRGAIARTSRASLRRNKSTSVTAKKGTA